MTPSDRQARDHLALADRHIAEAVDRLASQEEAVARLLPGTVARATAEGLLATMRQSFALMLAHRAMILRELSDADPV
jgi:hypothetical protein